MKQLIHRFSFTSLPTLWTSVAEPGAPRVRETGNHRKRLPRWPGLLLVGGLLLGGGHAEAALVTNTWKGAANANWSPNASWSGGLAPVNTSLAIVDSSLGGGSPVMLNVGPTIGGLAIASGFTVQTLAGNLRSITINAATATDSYLYNAGTISAVGTNLTLALNGSGTFTNAGIMETTAGATLALQDPSAGSTPVLNNSGTIRTVGSGILNLGVNNRGFTIKGGTLANPAGTVNQSTNGGVIMLQDVAASNGGTWNIIQTGNIASGNYFLDLAGTSTLANTGVLNITGDSDANSNNRAPTLRIGTAASFSNNGVVNVLAKGTGASTTYVGIQLVGNSTVINNGTINFTGQSTGLDARFLVPAASTLTLGGTGSVVLAVGAGGTASRVKISGTATSGLINGNGHTIRGAGQVGNNSFTNMQNDGTILADDASYALTIDPNSTTGVFTNTATGTLRATGAGGLVLGDGVYYNLGVVRVDGGSSLALATNAIFTSLGGTVRVDGTLTAPTNLTFAGGILQGTGAIRSRSLTITNGATLAPGDSIGTLTMSNLTLAFGAKLEFELAATNASDKVVDLGTLALNGLQWSNFTFLAQSGFGGGTYTLLDGVNLSGTLGTVTNGTISYNSLTYNGFLQLDNANKDLLLVVFDAIPEPSVLALVATGLAGVLTLRRRPSREP